MTADVDAAVQAAMSTLSERMPEHPVHRRSDLLALGISDILQSAMVRRGCLVRLRHGVYCLRGALETGDPLVRHRLDLAAAVAASREPTWAFGLSAAVLHDFPLPFAVPERLSLVRSSGTDERALRRPSQHRLIVPDASITTGQVDPATTTVIDGVPTVGACLAAVASSTQLTSSRWRTAIFDAALWRGGTTDEVQSLIDTWRHLGHRAELLAALSLARSGAQTVLETFSRLALIEQGLPEPVLQQAFHDQDGLIGFADMWWPSLGVIGESDGAIKYQSRDDLLKEKVREDRLRAQGWAVVRWTFRDIEERPAQVAGWVRRAARR